MYYLPIYVNNRRMHILKLDRNVKDQVLFSFLVDASDHYTVFSLPSAEIKMICDKGGDTDIDLLQSDWKLECVDQESIKGCYRHCEYIPIYNVQISKGHGSYYFKDCHDDFRLEGHLGEKNAPGEEPFQLKALKENNSPLREYIIQFSYEDTDNYGIKSVYTGAIRIIEYNNDDEFFKASLDFGSEASQVQRSTDVPGMNMNIRDAFIRLAKGDITIDYWQGRENEEKTLYKSIYHVHNNPRKTDFGDLPMNNDKGTFLQSVLPVTAPTKDFILLPNLKLIEQLPGIRSTGSIQFKEDSFDYFKGGQPVALTDKKLNDCILRQILCNFLAVVMNDTAKKYLYFVLLVPNVYAQEKVYKLIEGLYDDFNLLKGKEKLSHYKGIEVNIVSESDASFFGVRSQESDSFDNSGAHYLIIDAGKGTTDFSLIVQKGEGLSNYSSLYRSGIPASGHVLTYAFYHALQEWFYKLTSGKTFFNDIMKQSAGKETSAILEFVDNLEKFKINFDHLSEDDSLSEEAQKLIRNNNKQLFHLNTFLKSALSENKMIPGMTDEIKQKVDTMTSLIEKSIVSYAQGQHIVCEKVILTGRAFKLKLFKDAVSDMLVENHIVLRKENIIFEEHCAKSICTNGALKVDEQSVINQNSIMLGSPNLVEKFGDENNSNLSPVEKIKFWIRKHRHLDVGKSPEMSYDFFYRGLKLSNVKNATFSLSGIKFPINPGTSDDLVVYFVGDGYIWKHGNSSGKIAFNSPDFGIQEKLRQQLVRESLFPFNLDSFDLKSDGEGQSLPDDSGPEQHAAPASTPRVLKDDDDK